MTRHTYIVASPDGSEYSADSRDYWYAADRTPMNGALVRVDHPYRTNTGRRIIGARCIKRDVTVRDLRRIAR